jgi:methylthioribose-1-phosphate isomerase
VTDRQKQTEPLDPTGIHAVTWRDGRLDLLDQRRLPADVRRVVCEDVDAAIHCIRDMVVRGAPAIGITAAYAAVLAARSRTAVAGRRLAGRLPAGHGPVTQGAADRGEPCLGRRPHAGGGRVGGHDPVAALLDEARRMHAADIEMNVAMAARGADLIETRGGVITHCNAGSLATGGVGTALGVIREAWRRGLVTRVWVDETRPWLQGARLTAWELGREGIPATVITDSAAAQVMRREPPTWAIVGADRVAANGDVVNKIGTYGLAVPRVTTACGSWWWRRARRSTPRRVRGRGRDRAARPRRDLGGWPAAPGGGGCPQSGLRRHPGGADRRAGDRARRRRTPNGASVQALLSA